MEINFDLAADIIVLVMFAIALKMASTALKSNKETVATTISGMALNLIQQAENAVKGSGMGEEKKALVLKNLDAAGVKITQEVEELIDEIVDKLNQTGAWLISEAVRGMEHILIPKNISNIKEDAFQGIKTIETISIPESASSGADER